eukprot:3877069-Prorocentrum_lima.AAC.1
MGSWYNAWLWGSADERNVDTCTMQSGSRIDGILLSERAADYMRSYWVNTAAKFPTHRPVCIEVDMP